MPIPFIDLQAQYKSIQQEIDKAIQSVINSGRFILGQDVELLEKKIASYCGTKYAVGTASGTDAMHLALLSCDIGPGDEVITTPFTFIATTETIVRCGAKPIFADIDPKTYNIDPEKILSKITKKTKAILPVHLFGHSADMDKIMQISRKHKLKVIEDCAQAMGTLYKEKHVGSIGDCGALSFFPTKNLGCYGDGGMVITNNKEIAEKVKILRNHGAEKKYHYNLNGFNSRLDTIQAAILRVKLKHLDKWIEKRRKIASLYTKLLLNSNVSTPLIAPYTRHSFNYYTIRIPGGNRNKVQKCLSQSGIPTEIYYPLCLHRQNVYKSLGYKKGDFPIAEKCEDEILSLPIYPELTEKEVRNICQLIKYSVARPHSINFDLHDGAAKSLLRSILQRSSTAKHVLREELLAKQHLCVLALATPCVDALSSPPHPIKRDGKSRKEGPPRAIINPALCSQRGFRASRGYS